jgi:predicted AlkP superfamily phosphohydrolase/phosphomutase
MQRITQEENVKLLIIGLDGMTFDLINPLIEMGHLPNIARLMREGSHGTLISTEPATSPVAWSSFVTGKSPGAHGVYSWGVKTFGLWISANSRS